MVVEVELGAGFIHYLEIDKGPVHAEDIGIGENCEPAQQTGRKEARDGESDSATSRYRGSREVLSAVPLTY